jgi:hypothetical protein
VFVVGAVGLLISILLLLLLLLLLVNVEFGESDEADISLFVLLLV